jgi:hypothetical protein
LSAPFRRIGDRLSALSAATGLPKIIAGFGRVGDAAGALGTKVLGIGALFGGMAVAGGVALYGILRGAQEAGGRLKNLSTITGLSVNAFAELEFAAKRSGVENEAFAAGMQSFNKGLSQAKRGVGPLAELLKKVGPVYLHQLKAVKSNEEGFELLAKAMGQIKDPGKRAELAAAAFGKAGAGMVNVLKDGPAGVEALRAEFRKLAGDQSGFADGANELGDALDNMELAAGGLRNVLAGALFPAVTKVATAVTEFLVKNRDGLQKWAEKTGAAIEKWVDGGGVERLVNGLQSVARDVSRVVDKLGGLEGIAKLAAAAMGVYLAGSTAHLVLALGGLGKELALLVVRLGAPLLGALGRAGLAILSFNFGPLLAGLASGARAVWAFNAALLANPIGLVVVAIGLLAAAAYLIYKNWTPISGFFKDLWQTISFHTVEAWNTISGVVADVWNGIVDRVMAAWEKIKPVIEAIKTGFRFLASPTELISFGVNQVQQRFFNESPAASFGAAGAVPGPLAGQGTETRVVVDFNGLPRGARVTQDRGNTAPLDLNLGYAMGSTR